MAAVIYTLCGITSGFCAWLLVRAYIDTRSRLLLWSAVCFAGLALENVALWVDKIVFPLTDLSLLRQSIGLFAMTVLLFGLVWEAE
ncbi:MAG: hypothetical protein KGL35_27600 [Bradyrhizobium sp.]|uniref:DUF5985 family protein n=1 Tax=Bradyrhizobium sp. TaxID=376 RepID=UPI001C2898C3|nr:DUF5985 family protein [Bradyrhizobium sp.]MBU6463596.1 hypothetical protein [Pseudomonadota bacterium]MDE2067018.1 hypothetical protein [Bradyrhizobium sp.]MDE2472393.1 hypothetical protein [Bradyrhizobium sp.]